MHRAVTAEFIHIKFCILNPWPDVVTHACIFQTASKLLQLFWRVGCKFSLFSLTFALAFNTAYCATTHTRGEKWTVWGPRGFEALGAGPCLPGPLAKTALA